MEVAKSPCSSCPYRMDTPVGVWHASEYQKLPLYDDGPQGQQAFCKFLCHQSVEIGKDTLCRGWLTVHRESVAVRLLGMAGHVTEEQVYAEVKEPLYATGKEAAEAGMNGVKRPGKKAKEIIKKLAKRRRK